MPGLFLLSLLVCLLCIILIRGSFSLQAEENMGGEKKTNGDASQVDKERNWRASIFLSVNPLKINTSWFDDIATCWEYASLVVSLC